MAVVWADLAPAFAFSSTTLSSNFTGFPPADEAASRGERFDGPPRRVVILISSPELACNSLARSADHGSKFRRTGMILRETGGLS